MAGILAATLKIIIQKTSFPFLFQTTLLLILVFVQLTNDRSTHLPPEPNFEQTFPLNTFLHPLVAEKIVYTFLGFLKIIKF